jgi:aminopeptidase N
MVNLKFIALFCLVTVTLSLPRDLKNFDFPFVDELNARSFRLPNNTRPLHYDISLFTNIHRGDSVFNGRVRINIEVLEDSDVITMHYRDLIIRNVDLFNADGSVFQNNVAFSMQNDVEFLVLQPSTTLRNAKEIIADVSYTGILRLDGQGFFQSSYQSIDTNQEIFFAATQFQAVDARHAFPCYDEVKYRTTFDVQIIHHESYTALSNMPVSERETNENGIIRTHFERTLSMPVHTLAFFVSNFEFVETNAAGIPMRFFAEPSLISSGNAATMLDEGVLIYETFEEMFKIPFPLPKIDQVAITQIDNRAGMVNFIRSCKDDKQVKNSIHRKIGDYLHISIIFPGFLPTYFANVKSLSLISFR